MSNYDLAGAIQQPSGHFIAPRTDIAASEQCFVALSPDMVPRGFVQLFKDGSAAYWFEPMTTAKRSPSLELAIEALFTGHLAGTAEARASATGHLTG